MNPFARSRNSHWRVLGCASLSLLAITCCSCQSIPVPRSGAQNASPVRDSKRKAEPTRVHISDETSPAKQAALKQSPIAPAQFTAPQATVSAPCPVCPVAPPALPHSAFGGDWHGGDFQRPFVEEYVCNGGDQNVSVQVKKDWSVQGLHAGDAVVHYDTLDGKTVVEPSNEVCLYAPRFAAVRKVYGIVAHEQHDKLAGVEAPVGLELSSDRGQATTVVQPLGTGRKHSVRGMQSFREKTHGIGIDNAQRAAIAEEQFLPFEDFTIIKRGLFDNTEKARLSERLLAAVTWTGQQGLQVLIDNKTAIETTGTSSTQSVYTYELPPGKSRLRVVKIASKQNAKPGELVEFTLRFDNVGDQVIGNVTVIDKLHDRLEYVPGSARCSVPAEFKTEDEDGSPRVLRWEITDPLKVRDGGLIRFTCRVR